MERYQNGKIYRLVGEDGSYYIGSTCMPLHKRLWNHKACSKRPTRVYQHFNKLGWDKVKILLVEDYPCKDKNHLLLREATVIQEHLRNELCLNTNRSLIDPEQKRLEKLEKRRIWREENRERDRETVRKYQNKKREEKAGKKIASTDIDDAKC